MTMDVKDSPAAGSSSSFTLPWWTKGDTNAFFGLGFNILVNVLTLTTLSIAVVGIPGSDVLVTLLPALGIALILGNLYYMVLARRLAAIDDEGTTKRGGDDSVEEGVEADWMGAIECWRTIVGSAGTGQLPGLPVQWTVSRLLPVLATFR